MEENKKVELEVPPKGRLIWGGIVFVSGFLSPLLIPWVISLDLSTGIKSLISGLLALGVPELFMLIAVAILGKPGFTYLKQKIFSFFKKYGPADEVGPVRYKIGLLLFCLPLLIGFIWPYAGHYLPLSEQHSKWIHIGGDVMLFSSLFVLGGNFWDKLRSLFVYKSRAVLINDQPQKTNDHVK